MPFLPPNQQRQSTEGKLQHNINTKKLQPGLVAFYNIRPVNGTGLFSKEKIKEISKEKVKKNHKWGSIQYKQANKYIAPKSKIESRAHYTLEPAQGKLKWQLMDSWTDMTHCSTFHAEAVGKEIF